ncbi:Lysine decarboxylase, inducible [Raoultella terrigena]|uniref:Lysine decarboxylase, inducible n=1 Tax=Raoultella terrigena TaxID=577 RepID=A0A4U9D7N2_RAOTE|nr:Lysine decarboxylase, inducible [Raoultella terrigena]
MFRAFEVLPKMMVTPYAAFQKELHGQTEEIYLEEMVGRVNANMILPYPPGVPLVMPGEMITEESRPGAGVPADAVRNRRTTRASKPISTAHIVRRMVATPLRC